jgi:hypothetical protein
MRYRLRTLLIVLALGPMLLTSCGPEITRNNSSLIDGLDGVWTYSIESGSDNGSIPDSTSLWVVSGMKYKCYDYAAGRYSISHHGEVVGEEGVYFLQNYASYYSPMFFIESGGYKLLIFGKHDYGTFIKTGQFDAITLIRSADQLDFRKPPPRISMAAVGLPFHDDHTELGRSNPK